MERQSEALKIAIDLYVTPSRLRAAQAAPLPRGIDRVLAIAAGDGDELSAAAKEMGRADADVKRAAGFFIEHVLLAADADSYRLLGCERTAAASDLRRNMSLLMRWLHPDKQAEGVRVGIAQRVTNAWETLKLPERRAQYDLSLDAAERAKGDRRRRRGMQDGLRGRQRTAGSGAFWTSIARVLGLRR